MQSRLGAAHELPSTAPFECWGCTDNRTQTLPLPDKSDYWLHIFSLNLHHENSMYSVPLKSIFEAKLRGRGSNLQKSDLSKY